jgi:cell wall-associated NlpC family hydrolase
MLDRTKVLTTAVALLTGVLVTLPTAQGQANANEIQTKIEAVSKVSSQVILDTAKQYIGTPYCWGGRSTGCFDCSGLVKYVYENQGINLPPTANSQYKLAKQIPKSETVPGDLVFFISKSGYAYHVGIYAGNGKVLHSPKRGHHVRIETIWSSSVRYGRI